MEFEAAHINWASRAGSLLDQLLRALPQSPRLEINVFGSAPLQLFIEPSFLSADVDVFASEDVSLPLASFVEQHGWGKGRAELYIQVCDPFAFTSTHDWRSRAIEVVRHGHLLRIVHPCADTPSFPSPFASSRLCVRTPRKHGTSLTPAFPPRGRLPDPPIPG